MHDQEKSDSGIVAGLCRIRHSPFIGRVRICAGGDQQWPSLPRLALPAL